LLKKLNSTPGVPSSAVQSCPQDKLIKNIINGVIYLTISKATHHPT